ncbi:MAG: ATP synthase F0 subunit C [Candidatus Pacebacteria bacterium]|nr:ATP synthase F0 subunit C [Candidatus Paceibacterota bacterium]
MDVESATILAKGVATLSMFGTSIGQGYLIGKALEGMSRNPSVAGMLFARMIIGAAIAESAAIYALIVFFLL